MDLKLNDKHALVTGSTAGIGKAIAQRLLEEGASVTINGRSEKTVAAAVEQLKAYGPVQGIAADLGSAPGAAQLAEKAQAIAPVDILVNNTGIFEPVPFEDITDEQWEEVFRVNVMSGIRLSRALVAGMKQRDWGRIVFISSESALNIPEEMVHYGMSKTAQLAVSRGLAKTLRGTGVTVNSVLPGPTWTEGVAEMVKQIAAATGQSEETVRTNFVPENRAASIINRIADVEEVSAMVAYIVSPLASATTGAALRVEGGIVNTIG